MDARDLSLREDMLRAQSQEDEYKKQLQQAELEIRDHKNKLEMAREDLEKEKVGTCRLDLSIYPTTIVSAFAT